MVNGYGARTRLNKAEDRPYGDGGFEMSEQAVATVAFVAAGFGLIGSVVWVLMFRKGILTLQQIRDELRKRSA